MRPFHPFLPGGGTGTVIAVFGIECGFLGVFLVPVVPSGLQYVVTEFASDKHRLRIWAPRPSEIDLGSIFIVRQPAVAENVAPFLPLRRGCCGDIAVFLAQDGAVFEPCRGESEDEIGGALDMAAPEKLALPGTECIDGILIRDETSGQERHPVSVHRYGTGLTDIL